MSTLLLMMGLDESTFMDGGIFAAQRKNWFWFRSCLTLSSWFTLYFFLFKFMCFLLVMWLTFMPNFTLDGFVGWMMQQNQTNWLMLRKFWVLCGRSICMFCCLHEVWFGEERFFSFWWKWYQSRLSVFFFFGVCIETLFDYANLSRLELAFPALNMLDMSAWDGVKSLTHFLASTHVCCPYHHLK